MRGVYTGIEDPNPLPRTAELTRKPNPVVPSLLMIRGLYMWQSIISYSVNGDPLVLLCSYTWPCCLGRRMEGLPSE